MSGQVRSGQVRSGHDDPTRDAALGSCCHPAGEAERIDPFGRFYSRESMFQLANE
jgi:hypothetical protein